MFNDMFNSMLYNKLHNRDRLLYSKDTHAHENVCRFQTVVRTANIHCLSAPNKIAGCWSRLWLNVAILPPPTHHQRGSLGCKVMPKP